MGEIIVRGLGKAYKIYPNRWTRLAEWLLPLGKPRHDLKWVMKDVSFSISPGEAVGIIGLNGAGKSTLLKMITGTTIATTGTVNITGRVAALLELGMGFHPEFTGRQNVYMAGQLLGFTADEIALLMPEIEAFADIGDYIDHPVRVYSSGMQMRLAFSVATASRPDVLIVDEALSVGDAKFQHKCFDRIRGFRKLGTTLLIVSHDKAAIQSICDRAILLNDGRLEMEDSPEAVMDYYNAMLTDNSDLNVQQISTESGRKQTISGTGEVSIISCNLVNEKSESIEVVKVGEAVTLKIIVESNEDVSELVLGYQIKDRVGQPVFGTNTFFMDEKLVNVNKNTRVEFLFHFPMNIGVGDYSIAIALHKSDSHIEYCYEWRDLAVLFNVVNVGKQGFVGSAWIPPKLEIHS